MCSNLTPHMHFVYMYDVYLIHTPTYSGATRNEPLATLCPTCVSTTVILYEVSAQHARSVHYRGGADLRGRIAGMSPAYSSESEPEALKATALNDK